MKQGRSIVELAQELERQKESKRDYHVNTEVMGMRQTGRTVMMGFQGTYFRLTQLAHRQVGQKLGIPAKYYDKMLIEQPALLMDNVNIWLHQKEELRLIRTLDDNMRAFLSAQYRPLDNIDLAEAVLPILTDMEYEVKSCEITENKFYLKAVTSRITDEVVKGDVVQSGICISNSEVGLGRLSVEPLVYRLVCDNGMIVNDYGIRKNHVGRKQVTSHDVSEFYRDETKQADDKAFWMKVQDTVRATADEVKFRAIVDTLREADQRVIKNDPVRLVENVAARYNMPDDDRGSILSHLITGGSLTQYALGNAITRMAQDVESYDKSTEYEHVGADVVALPQTDWNSLNAA